MTTNTTPTPLLAPHPISALSTSIEGDVVTIFYDGIEIADVTLDSVRSRVDGAKAFEMTARGRWVTAGARFGRLLVDSLIGSSMPRESVLDDPATDDSGELIG